MSSGDEKSELNERSEEKPPSAASLKESKGITSTGNPTSDSKGGQGSNTDEEIGAKRTKQGSISVERSTAPDSLDEAPRQHQPLDASADPAAAQASSKASMQEKPTEPQTVNTASLVKPAQTPATEKPTSTPDAVTTTTAAPKRTLRIKAISARGLKNVEMIGKNDPFCELGFATFKFRSSTQKAGGSKADWTFEDGDDNVCFEASEEELRARSLIVRVSDENRLLAHALIGEGGCSLEKLWSGAPGSSADFTVALVDKKNTATGEVVITIDVVDTAARLPQKTTEALAAAVKVDVPATVRDIVEPEVARTDLNVSSSDEELEETVPVPELSTKERRKLLMRRVREEAAKEGHMGGMKVPSRAEAATAIQSTWRSKLVRRDQRRLVFYATAMQRRVRGRQQRNKYLEVKTQFSDLKRQEAQRLDRLRRIRTKERELVMLRMLPSDQFLSVDRLRRESSIRLLQRFWRRKKEPRRPLREETQGPMDPQQEQMEKLYAYIDSHLPPPHVVAERRTDQRLKVDMDTLGLAQLHRRIKDAAQLRIKADDGAVRFEGMSPIPKGLDMLPVKNHKYLARSQVFSNMKPTNIGGARKNYQDMLQIQGVASVYLDEYYMNRDALERGQRDRLQTLGHCASLMKDLKSPLTLEEAYNIIEHSNRVANANSPDEDFAREGNLFKTPSEEKADWFSDIPREGLPDAIRAHLRTTTAMESVGKKWYIVAAPHDVTGPPIDLRTLPSVQYENLLHNFSYDRFNTPRDKEESLWWVSYAAQKTVFPDRTPNPEFDIPELRGGWTAEGQPAGNESQRAAQELLGEVKGEELLQRVALDVMTLPDRAALLDKICRDEDTKVKRLAKILLDEIQTRKKGINRNLELSALSKEELRRRTSACIRIQAFVRGAFSRAATKVKRAEHRVISALGILIDELSHPELKSKAGKNMKGSNLLAKLQSVMREPVRPPRDTKVPQPVQSTPAKKTSRVHYATPSASATLQLQSPGTVTRDESFTSTRLSPSTLKKASRRSGSDTKSEDSKRTLHFEGEPDPESSYDPLSYISSPSFRDESSLEISGSLFSPKSPESKHSVLETTAEQGITIQDPARSSDRAINATEDAYKTYKCVTQKLVDSTIKADLKNFIKSHAVDVMSSLVSYCGIPALRKWLHGFTSDGAIPIRNFALLLAELAHNLGLVNDEVHGPIRIIQLVMLLRLLADDTAHVNVQGVLNFAEDAWMLQMGSSHNSVREQLAQMRLGLIKKASAEATSPQKVFESALPSKYSALSSILPLPVLLSTSKKLFPHLKLSSSDAASILKIAFWGNHADGASVGDVVHLLAPLVKHSSRVFQKKVQILTSKLPLVSQYLQERSGTGLQSFLAAVDASEFPLTQLESLILANLLRRDVGGAINPMLLDKISRGEYLKAPLSPS